MAGKKKMKRKAFGRSKITARDWTQGNIVGNVIRLSWPMALSNTLIMLGPLLDMIWVGRLGSAEMAAIASGGILIGLVIATVMGLAMGSRAIIARYIGAGDTNGANHVAQQSLFISLVFSILMAGIGFFLASTFLRLMGLSADVVTVGTPYLRILFIGSAAIAFRMMTEGILQASGDTVTPMWASFVYIATRIIFSPLLIFGRDMFPWLRMPGLGIQGAAVAMTVAYGAATVIMLAVLFAGRSRLQVTMRNFSLDLNIIWRITRIGFPSLISMAQRNLAQLIFVRLMAPFGTVAVAAHGLLQRVEGLFIMPSLAVGIGSGVLVGQNLGAGQPERAGKSAWRAFLLMESVMAVFAVALLMRPDPVVKLFSTEPELVATANSFIRIAAVGYLFVGFFTVFTQSINGAGDTTATMIISVTSIWAIALPLAIILPRATALGVYGVRWGMTIDFMFNGLVHMIYFICGRWKRKQV